MQGDVEDGNVSIVIPLDDPGIIEADISEALRLATFKKSQIYKAFREFLNATGKYHMIDVAYAELLKELTGIDFYIKIG